jgi:RNA polymerase sigma-70 factor (ECF subfamily)
MSERDWQVEQFEEHRPHLHAVAYRMLGSMTEADDALQEAWLRLSRSDTHAVDNMAGWLTTVVGRVCLDVLRTRRRAARTTSAPGCRSRSCSRDDRARVLQQEALDRRLVAGALRRLETPHDQARSASRSCFSDMFARPFDEIAPIIEVTGGGGAGQAAARRRVQAPRPTPMQTFRIRQRDRRRVSPRRATAISRHCCVLRSRRRSSASMRCGKSARTCADHRQQRLPSRSLREAPGSRRTRARRS